MTALVVEDVRLLGSATAYSVVVEGRDVVAVQPRETLTEARPGTLRVQARGGTLLPGLRDAHVHLGAWLRSRQAYAFPPSGLTQETWKHISSSGRQSNGWYVLFGMDHHHCRENTLDLIDSERRAPVVVVHRTGRRLLVNTVAAGLFGLGHRATETHQRGLLRRALPALDRSAAGVLLASLRDSLLRQGVVTVQDATPYPSTAEARCRYLAEALRPVRVDFMGSPCQPVPFAKSIKLLDPLKTPKVLDVDRPLAIHAVEPEEIIQGLSLLNDREGSLEHAAICPPGVAASVAAAPHVTVTSNPSFLLERSAALASVTASGLGAYLHPAADLVDRGVRVDLGSDAPVTSAGVWPSIRAATLRGQSEVPFPGRALTLRQALQASTAHPELLDSRVDAWAGVNATFAVVPTERLNRADADMGGTVTVIDGRIEYLASDDQ
jgi:predicted amidohydrolase YtcJ